MADKELTATEQLEKEFLEGELAVNERRITEAMFVIMPNGGWYTKNYVLCMHEGYKRPAKEILDAEIAKVVHNEPIKEELQNFSNKLLRESEAYFLKNPEEDAFLTDIATKKRALRAKLKK